MSFVAGRDIPPSTDDVPDVDDGGEKVIAGAFWPEITLIDVRTEMRINGAVTTTRLRHVVTEAVIHVSEQLASWQAKQLSAGYTSLSDVPAMMINGMSVKVYRFRRAVFSCSRALLLETFRDVDTTGEAGEKRALALSTQAQDLWRDVRWAIADIQGATRNFTEAF